MLNASDEVVGELKVLDYSDAKVSETMKNGKINTEADVIVQNVVSSIRRGHPQMKPSPEKPDRICLVGSGPSLETQQVQDELRQLLWEGAVLVTMNGAYHWCIARNLRPQTQIVMDARPTNSRFVDPDVPRCNYVLASQCAPEVWDAVQGRPNVWIFHAVTRGKEDASAILDDYYCGNWIGVGGGTTVATRAINLLRMSGYLRFDLFGVDCCWDKGKHHAMAQPENDHDKPSRLVYGIPGQPKTDREFVVSPWMLKQLEDFLTVIHPKVSGSKLQLEVHGDGLLAYAMRTLAAEVIEAT